MTGNIKYANRRCPNCDKIVKCQRNGMVWGLGDFIMVLLTAGIWVIIRFIFNALLNPWRCADCGMKT